MDYINRQRVDLVAQHTRDGCIRGGVQVMKTKTANAEVDRSSSWMDEMSR